MQRVHEIVLSLSCLIQKPYQRFSISGVTKSRIVAFTNVTNVRESAKSDGS
jgi:hypothetical protein